MSDYEWDGKPVSKRTWYRRRAALGLTQPVKKHTFNEAFFDQWSHELAWLVGVIWSDGCLFGNTIEIATKDWQLIELAAAIIDGSGIRPKNNGTALRLLFTSKQVADWFRSIGLTEAKSLTVGWPVIPERYEAAFVRGLIDGDGSVLLRQDRPGQQAPDLVVQCVGGSEPMLVALSAWLDHNGIRHSTRWSRPTLWRVEVRQQAALRSLHELLYPTQDVPCLHRKRIPYDHWLVTPRARSGRPKKVVSELRQQ